MRPSNEIPSDHPARERSATRHLSVLGLALLAWGCGQQGDPLLHKGIPVTTGAAAGYVPDQTCAGCHTDIFGSYQEVGMARSFYRPRAERMIEDFDGEPFYHPASGRFYRMHRDGETLRFERYQLGPDGRPIHRFEVEVDWILGSGHTSRTYLYQTAGGELFQLPIAWYTQSGRWGMAPGFDNGNHLGVQRPVKRECLFCHNAYPQVPAGSDAYGAPDTFPTELPEGIGCQRCHGPGADHVRAALRGERAAVRATIVDPGRLAAERAVEICYGCHFQPSVALAGVRRFGRGTFSFRPGEPLTDYLAPIDVDEAGQRRDQRFEINHHPYRLEQSACFLASEPGALTCTTCHDPHRAVPEAQRQVHYRDACLACHQLDDCALEAMGDAAGSAAAGGRAVAADDCVACHMPRRRTQDVVQVVMTDHRIQRRPGGPELTAPLAESTAILVDAELIRPLPDVPAELEAIYRASAVVRAGGNPEAADFLARALPGRPLDTPEPMLDLINALIGVERYPEAEAAATQAIATWPGLVLARDWRAAARIRMGAYQEALADLDAVLAAAGERPEALFNQGLVLFTLGHHQEAVDALQRAVALRAAFPRAWAYLGRALLPLDRLEEAEHALRRALAVDPADTRTTVDLGRLLARRGRRAEALRLLEHGARHAREPEVVARALAAMRGSH